MRLILLVAVVALGYDAVQNNGAYTQSLWNEVRARIGDLSSEVAQRAPNADATAPSGPAVRTNM